MDTSKLDTNAAKFTTIETATVIALASRVHDLDVHSRSGYKDADVTERQLNEALELLVLECHKVHLAHK